MPSIRTKLSANLLLAAALPLLVAILTLVTYGYRHQVRQTGATYYSEAEHVAMNLEAIVQRQVGAIQDLLALTDLPQLLGEAVATQPLANETEITAIEMSWPRLIDGTAELEAFLNHPISERMRRFQGTHSLFAEIFVTDTSGRLLAATQKTSDYFQADEAWWQTAVKLPAGEVWVEGLEFDKSARVLSLDVGLPVYVETGGQSVLVGVMKAVIDASPLFASIPFLLSEQDAEREIIRGDGAVLLRLLDENFAPGGFGLSKVAMEALNPDTGKGWSLEENQLGYLEMIGIAPLRLFGRFSDRSGGGKETLYVIVRHDADALLSPLRRQILFIVTMGLLLSAFAVSLGNYFSRKHLLDPLATLRRAAHTVAATANHGKDSTESFDSQNESSTAEMVAQVSAIRTNDELELFGQDFVRMARQLLNYQEQLEADVAAKTAEIQNDLAMARDFQQALLPQKYPLLPPGSRKGGLALEFHHVYHPAAHLSGDFFDLIKVNDHCAGIIVADVMGHGTRSALVTAIFRALLQEATHSAENPSRFLSAFNKAFYSIIQETGQVVFVTAVYLVINTQTGRATCASAGHPSPLKVNCKIGQVEPVFKDVSNGPALGLMSESEHPPQSWQMHEHDRVFLFTDGIVEASNPDGDEFETERLTRSIEKHLNHELAVQVHRVVRDATDFTWPNQVQDDLCLIGVEAYSGKPR